MAFSAANLKTYVCTHVFDATRPILLVVHDHDGSWSFMCGAPHEDSSASYRVVGVGHLISRDPSLNRCADLPVGSEAERSALEQPWIRKKKAPNAC